MYIFWGQQLLAVTLNVSHALPHLMFSASLSVLLSEGPQSLSGTEQHRDLNLAIAWDRFSRSQSCRVGSRDLDQAAGLQTLSNNSSLRLTQTFSPESVYSHQKPPSPSSECVIQSLWNEIIPLLICRKKKKNHPVYLVRLDSTGRLVAYPSL